MTKELEKIYARDLDDTRREGRGKIFSARVFFPFFFLSPKSKATRRPYGLLLS